MFLLVEFFVWESRLVLCCALALHEADELMLERVTIRPAVVRLESRGCVVTSEVNT